jgi:flagellar biosynthesis protein
MKDRPGNKERMKAAALKYRAGEDKAPRVVARGKGLVAERIMEIAREHGVPIKEDRALVEILASLELNEEIPAELYRAVAEVLAFVYKMSKSEG